jgi:hypothetical protein
MILTATLPVLPPGNALNNREWATLIWLGIVAISLLSWKDMRPLLANVVRSAAKPVLVLPAVALWGWTALLVVAASRVHLWTGDLVKDTVIWSIGPALGLYWSVTKVSEDPQFFRRLALSTIGYTVLIEFYVNLRVFSLLGELVLLPTITFVALMAVVAARDKKYSNVKTVIDVMMSLAGLGLLVYVTIALVSSWHAEDLGHDVRDLLLPAWLTVGAVPYVYGLSLFFGYQSAFGRIDWWMKGQDRAARRAKLALVVELNVRTHLVNRFGGRWLNELAEARTFSAARDVARGYRQASSSLPKAALIDRSPSG